MIPMENTYNLQGKKILLTGANGKLGQAYALALLQSGAFVYVTDVQAQIDPVFAAQLSDKKLTQYEYLALDITSEVSLQQVQKRVGALDVLINNAGAKGVKGPFEERTAADIDAVLAVQVKGTMLATQEFTKEMIKQKSGTVINIGSVYGTVAPDKNIYKDPRKINSEIYGATKAATIHFTKYLAAYLGEYGITANCISPGGVFHDGQDPFFVEHYSAKVPLGRMANADDLVGVVCFLSSDDARYITGQNIVVDGGFTL